jgi:hypothetical protein
MNSVFADFPDYRESKAFAEYCDLVYGYGLMLDSSLAQEDIDVIVAYAQLSPSGRVLELGAGNGELLSRVCAESGKVGAGAFWRQPGAGAGLYKKALLATSPTGLFSRAEELLERRGQDEVISLADGRARLFPDDPNSLAAIRASFSPNSFDFIYMVDQADRLPNLRLTLDFAQALLSEDGILLIAHTELADSPESPELDFRKTKMAQALTRRGLNVRGKEITKSERMHWKIARRALEALKETFQSENRDELWQRLSSETDLGVARNESNSFKRYWYRVKKGR